MHKTHWWRALALALALLLQGGLGQVAHAAGGQVWLNTNSGVYHCPGTRYYGNTKRGEFIEESVAVSQGYRPAYGSACSSEALEQGHQAAIQSLAPQAIRDQTRVWINSSSHVYHCPGTRYYGNTKHGRYASEAEAISSGNRPAYGNRCN